MADNLDPQPVSPASAGNAGAHFEARVGAYYYLSMVAGGEPRGLPGSTISLVSLQQRMSGHPLDDVVIHAMTADGRPATLEIQAKRSMTFTASDKEFVDVVALMWAAAQKAEFETTRYELAVAISRTTTRVEQAVQDVLHWARVHSDAMTFHANIRRTGFASEQMRDFVQVVRGNLEKCGGAGDDEVVWKLLRRFQVLVFDFEAEGSAFEHFALERCRLVLAADQGGRAADLWAALITDAEEAARAAGQRSRSDITSKLAAEGGYRFGAQRGHDPSFARLAEEARFALADVDDQIGGARISRGALIQAGGTQLVTARLLNITGAPGSGKSMVMKRLVELSAVEGRVIVLRGGRIVGGGWLQLAQALGTSSPPEQFFTDLAAAGGATLFIDNIDQIEDQRERATISDLLRVAAAYPGWRVVVTTTEEGEDWTKILPDSLVKATAVVNVPEISDEEATVLSEQNGAVADLLQPHHPAKRIARNLFYLSRLVSAGSVDANRITTETDLARLWWSYGAGRDLDAGRFGRLRVLRRMAAEFLAHPGRPATQADDLESSVVAELLRLHAIREEVRGAEVAFRHDVFRDWTVGLMIADQPTVLKQLPKSRPISTAAVRGLELAARLALDEDPTRERWRELLGDASGPEVHGSWRRPLLLALPRAENSIAHFDALKPVLFANDGALLGELVRLLVVVDSQSITEVMSRLQPGFKVPGGAMDFVYPKGSSWLPTIVWLTRNAQLLPPPVIPDVAKAFLAWLMATSGFGLDLPINNEIVAVLFSWLELLGEEERPRSFRDTETLPALLNIPHHKDAYEFVRLVAFSFALVNVDAARGYLAKLNQSDVSHRDFESIIKGRGAMARAAPTEFSDFLMAGLIEPEDDDPYSSHRDRGPFGYHEHIFLTAGPSQGPMLEMLQHAPEQGLALVRRIVEHATDWQRKRYRRSNMVFPRFEIPLTFGKQAFEGDSQVYRFARSSQPSSLTTSALMALEAWAHQRAEAAEDPETILRDVLGPNGGSSAFVAVALDVALSHWQKFFELAWPFAASPQVLKLDEDRHLRDAAGLDEFRLFPEQETPGAATRGQLKARWSRQSRLLNALPIYVLQKREDIGPKLKAALEQAVKEIAPPEPDEDADPIKGLYAVAKRAARMADPANWQDVILRQDDGTDAPYLQYVAEEADQKLIDERRIAVTASTQKAGMIAAIHLAFRDGVRATPDVVADAIEWAKTVVVEAAPSSDEDEFEVEQTKRAVLMTAVLVARHAEGDARAGAVAWALPVLKEATAGPGDDTNHSLFVEYNSTAIAAAGLMTLYEKTSDAALRPDILQLATNEHDAVANALAGGFAHLRAVDQPFLRSIFRMLLFTSSYVARRHDGSSDKRVEERESIVKAFISAELVWLETAENEPAWPHIAPWHVRSKRRLRIPGPGTTREAPRKHRPAPEIYASESRLGLISSHLISLAVGDRPAWLLGLTKHIATWAIEANGPDEDDRDADGRPFTFNANFYDYLGILIASLPHEEAMQTFVRPSWASR